MDQRESLELINKLCQGMVKKDRYLLEEAMSEDAYLYHLTGQRESREQYIKDIEDGILNYYDYKIIDFKGTEAAIKLLAKVYNSALSWWTLKMSISFKEVNGIKRIKECKVRLG